MIRIKEMTRSMTNRRVFRTIARDNCGESMEPGENEIMYFGYSPVDEKMKGEVIACASIQFASSNCCDDKKYEYYHWITFLFIKKDYKKRGYGRQFMNYLEIELWNSLKRPIRIDAAYKAVRFFEKCGYVQIGEPKECACGSSLFRFLYLLEKQYQEYECEDWDT